MACAQKRAKFGLADYLMPTIAEIPTIEVTLFEDAPTPLNPLGVKGAGEAGISAAGAAIAAAVDDAIHERLLLAAVDLDHRAVNKMRQIRSEVGDKAGDLLAFDNALQRNAARGKCISLLARDFHVAGHRIDETGPALGTDWPGIDRHKADIVLAVLRSERERQVLPGSICRAWRDLPIGRFDPVIANQVDDAAAPLLLHDRQHVLQATHITHEFELQ